MRWRELTMHLTIWRYRRRSRGEGRGRIAFEPHTGRGHGDVTLLSVCEEQQEILSSRLGPMDVAWAATASIAHLQLPSERWALMAVDTRGYDGCGNQDFRRGYSGCRVGSRVGAPPRRRANGTG